MLVVIPARTGLVGPCTQQRGVAANGTTETGKAGRAELRGRHTGTRDSQRPRISLDRDGALDCIEQFSLDSEPRWFELQHGVIERCLKLHNRRRRH